MGALSALRTLSPVAQTMAAPAAATGLSGLAGLETYERLNNVRPETDRPDSGWEWLGTVENAGIDALVRAPIAAYKTARQWATPQKMAAWKGMSGSILRDAGALSMLDATVKTAGDVYNTDTDRYYKRFGFDPNTVDRTLGKDLGIRTLGATSDLGARITDFIPFIGDTRRFYRDYQE